MTLELTDYERSLIGGSQGDATAMAMRILVSAAELVGAGELVEIRSAHIDGCLHHGDGGLVAGRFDTENVHSNTIPY